MFKMVAFAGIFALTAMFAGSVQAQFPDGAKVMMKYPGWNPGTPTITLKKEGVDKAGGIYTIQVEGQDKYLMAKDSEAGTTVGLSTPDAKVTPTKWILHQHGVPFQIMHTANAANAISVNKDKNGLVLRRNQGDELQRIVIQEIRSRNLGGGLDIKWTNKTGVPITVNWIDAGGKEMPSDRIIKPNEFFDGSTVIGHVFRVRDEKRAEIYLIEVEATSAKVDISYKWAVTAAALNTPAPTAKMANSYEEIIGNYTERTGGQVTIRKADVAKQEAGPFRFILLGGSTPGNWHIKVTAGVVGSEDNFEFMEGPFKGSRYLLLRNSNGKVNLHEEKGNKTIWIRQ